LIDEGTRLFQAFGDFRVDTKMSGLSTDVLIVGFLLIIAIAFVVWVNRQ
jgi:hypothetical protein